MKMKRIFVMILMLGISMPAVASEVTLECLMDIDGKQVTETYSFDEAAGKVYYIDLKGIKREDPDGFITRETFGSRRQNGSTYTISRATGNISFSWDTVHATGKCTLFKQAF
jgi:hypothetical protein